MIKDKVDINIVAIIFTLYLFCYMQFYYVKIKNLPFYLNRKGKVMRDFPLYAVITINE